jgi:hypothetical protein
VALLLFNLLAGILFVGPRRTVLLTASLVALGLLGKALSRHWLQAGA